VQAAGLFRCSGGHDHDCAKSAMIARWAILSAQKKALKSVGEYLHVATRWVANAEAPETTGGVMSDSAARMANGEGGSGNGTSRGTAVITRTRPKTKKPSLYRVLILNDDYTPMEFVVHVLERFFQKDREAATRIMLHVHNHGVGECGIFTFEVAETKVSQVMDVARQHQHPLQCVMEKK